MLRGDLQYFKMVLRNDMEGAPERREKGRECVEQPMASDSQSKIVAQAREAISGLVSHTAHRRAHDLAKRDEAQGVAGGPDAKHWSTRHENVRHYTNS